MWKVSLCGKIIQKRFLFFSVCHVGGFSFFWGGHAHVTFLQLEKQSYKISLNFTYLEYNMERTPRVKVLVVILALGSKALLNL